MSFLLSLLHYVLTIFGIGLVIFVHELGHYLAARAVGIRVEAFSIGFGPRLIGFRRGPTDYKLCLIPLGGFVKMAGENPQEPRAGATDEFASKTVPQRSLVICAGVIMNVVFALVALPAAFMIGVPFDAPVLGTVTVGGPAWKAGLRGGDRLLDVGGVTALGFDDLVSGAATADGPLKLVVERDGRRIETAATPLRDPVRGIPVLLVTGAEKPIKLLAPAVDPAAPADTASGHRARAGLRAGDEIVAVDGLPVAEWTRGPLAPELLRLAPRLLRVRRDGGETEILLPPLAKPAAADAPALFGVDEGATVVDDLLPGTPAAAAGLKAGDRVAAVDGVPVATGAGLRRALVGGVRKLGVVRADGAAAELTSADATAFARSLHFDVAYRPSGVGVVAPREGGAAAAAGLRAGDALLAVDSRPAAGVADLAALPAERKAVSVTVRRGDGSGDATFAIARAPLPVNAAFEDIGTLEPLRETVRASFGDAWSKGAAYTVTQLKRVVGTLRSIFARRVAAENLGGIISIFRTSVASTEIAPSRGLLFLAFISINLAVLNILPIPVLDGGWLLFLLIEAVRKKPVPDRVLAASQWVGFALVLGLMLYVTWNDLVRLFGW